MLGMTSRSSTMLGITSRSNTMLGMTNCRQCSLGMAIQLIFYQVVADSVCNLVDIACTEKYDFFII